MSSIVGHVDNTRRVWMVPKNIRLIYPWKIAQIVTLIGMATDDADWSGNQDIQNRFRQSLEDAGLIRPGRPYDPNSGGPRTYFSQMKCLGLIYQDEDGKTFLTKAGRDIVNGEPPLEIMQKMLLRHQYPSAYGGFGNVRINPGIKIKPFLFILEFLLDRDVEYLTKHELAVLLVYGHNRKCFEICKNKIMKMRKGQGFKDVIDDKRFDLYTPRTRNSAFKPKLNNVLDVSNIFKNYLQACCLVETNRVAGEDRININGEYISVVKDALVYANKFIPCGGGEESFQRPFGAWDGKKDTRSNLDKGKAGAGPDENMILSQFYRFCGENIVSNVDGFVSEMVDKFGFTRKQVLDVVTPHLDKVLDYFESTFIEMSRSGTKRAVDFEKAICELFADKFHFKAEHTGQKRKKSGVGAYSDVFLISLDDDCCGIVDAKASANYNLPSSDYRAMVGDYIPNCADLAPGDKLNLEFVSYVAGGYSSTIDSRLAEINKATGVPCSALTALDILKLAKLNIGKSDQPKVRRFLAVTGTLNTDSF